LRGDANQFSLRERYTFRTEVLKVLRKSPRLSHLGHARGLACVREHLCRAKNQKISLHFPRVSSPHPSTAKRPRQWKGNFWFCFAVSVSEKSIIILSYFDCSYLRPHGDPRRPCISFWWKLSSIWYYNSLGSKTTALSPC